MVASWPYTEVRRVPVIAAPPPVDWQTSVIDPQRPCGDCDRSLTSNHSDHNGDDDAPKRPSMLERVLYRMTLTRPRSQPIERAPSARDAESGQLAVDHATEAIARRHGEGPVAGKPQAHMIVAAR